MCLTHNDHGHACAMAQPRLEMSYSIALQPCLSPTPGVASIVRVKAFTVTEDPSMHTLDSTLRMLWFISGCYFIYTGASKMASPRPLLTAILSYRITGPHISRALAALTAPTEFFCGLLLASGVFPSGSAALLIALLLVS